jgi:hypothetical protein
MPPRFGVLLGVDPAVLPRTNRKKAGLAIIPNALSIVAEGMISPLGVFSWAWTAGILIKTAGHQSMISMGNGNDPRTRNILATGPPPGAVSLGLGVRHRIDILY